MEYLKELEEKGWVRRVEEGNRNHWKVTDEGKRVIGELSRVERMMQDFGLEL